MLKNNDNVKSKSVSKHFNKAFTIVELLIVIVIIGVLAAITIVSYTGISKKAGESTVQAELANAKKQIALYHVDHGVYPTSLEDGTNCLKGTVAPSPDTKYCLKSSAGSIFTLTDATGSDYTLTLTKGTTIAYKVTKDTGPISTTPVVAGAASFVKTWGGTGSDNGWSLIQTSDGGYAITGFTTSFGAGSHDMSLIKYDSNGNLVWNKTWGGGGTNSDIGTGLIQIADGSYIITGSTASYGAGNTDVFLAKFDTSGNLIWNKTWGGANADSGWSVIQTADSGYAVTGYTASYGAGNYDSLLIKYDASGNVSWSKTWGGANYDNGRNLIQTSDGGYAITGYTGSYGAGSEDAFLAKYDSSGGLSWIKTWGGSLAERGEGVIGTSDGGYAITGYTASYSAGSNDMFIVKYDSSGAITWNKTWGGTGVDSGKSLVQNSDNSYTVAGIATSYGAGSYDAVLLKYDNSGALTWNKTWGGTGSDEVNSLVKTNDGGYAITGQTTSYSAGDVDIYIIKYNSTGNINNCSSPMCQSPTATVTTPSATVNTPTVTVTTPSATVTTPTATITTPTVTITTVVAP